MKGIKDKDGSPLTDEHLDFRIAVTTDSANEGKKKNLPSAISGKVVNISIAKDLHHTLFLIYNSLTINSNSIVII